MSEGLSLTRRAALAVALTIGFYTLALGMSGGMLWTVYRHLTDGDHIRVKNVVFGTAASLAILWSVMPRWPRRADPGLQLLREDQPRLFAFMEAAAARAGQPLPPEVYLVPGTVAAAGTRGGILGVGGTRYLMFGLGLFATLSRSELESILLHELAHHRNRDLALIPLVVSGREAIARSVKNLARVGGHFHRPFRWYGRHYLRLTRAIAREQERAADAFALEHGGRGPRERALRSGSGAGFHAYSHEELLPALRAGLRPPVAVGYQRFLASPHGQSILAEALEQRMSAEAQPGRTHPTLRERLAMTEAYPELPPSVETPSLLLLDDLPSVGRAVVDWWMVGASEERTEVSWDVVGTLLIVPAWFALVMQADGWLRGRTAADIPRTAAGYEAVARASLPASIVRNESAEALADFGRSHCARAATLLLVTQGFRLMSLPGEPIFCLRDDERVDIIGWLREREEGDLSEDGYRFRLAELGVEDVDLGEVLTS
jgi:heat shock protein HtpX